MQRVAQSKIREQRVEAGVASAAERRRAHEVREFEAFRLAAELEDRASERAAVGDAREAGELRQRASRERERANYEVRAEPARIGDGHSVLIVNGSSRQGWAVGFEFASAERAERVAAMLEAEILADLEERAS